jgi:hypothetical protein
VLGREFDGGAVVADLLNLWRQSVGGEERRFTSRLRLA